MRINSQCLIPSAMWGGDTALMSFVKRRGEQHRLAQGSAGLEVMVRMGVGARLGTLVNKL